LIIAHHQLHKKLSKSTKASNSKITSYFGTYGWAAGCISSITHKWRDILCRT